MNFELELDPLLAGKFVRQRGVDILKSTDKDQRRKLILRNIKFNSRCWRKKKSKRSLKPSEDEIHKETIKYLNGRGYQRHGKSLIKCDEFVTLCTYASDLDQKTIKIDSEVAIEVGIGSEQWKEWVKKNEESKTNKTD